MSDKLETYYQDHWKVVEDERMKRYEAMFQWRDGQSALIAGADLAEGQIVADYGCGPGALSIELARRVGGSGRVVALDINADFLERTRSHAERSGVSERIDTRLMPDHRIPADDGELDRVICKNVLEYVPDPAQTLQEFHRILRPGGIAHVIDSDWGAIMLEPLRDEFAEIMSGARVAFRTPLIGRSLYGLFRKAGFSEVKVEVIAGVDTTGGMRPVLRNMAGYAQIAGQLSEQDVERFVADVDRAVDSETYMALLPQFLVTGTR